MGAKFKQVIYAGQKLVDESGGGGGGDVTVESLSVTSNGTYTAPEGKAYSPVSVNVSGGGGEIPYGLVPCTITATYEYNGSAVTPDGFSTENCGYSIADNYSNYLVNFVFGDYGLPTAGLGTVNSIKVLCDPNNYIIMGDFRFEINGVSSYVIDTYISEVISGDATIVDGKVKISGDCAIKFVLVMAD